MERRRFLALCGGALACAAVPSAALAGLEKAARGSVGPYGTPSSPRIWLHNMHTHERMALAFRHNGRLIPESLNKINRFLRDHRTGEVCRMDPGLMDILFSLARETGAKQPFQVVSGYRSPQTNAMLAQKSRSVAKKSLHTKGMAVDLFLPGCDTHQLYLAAKSLKMGGAGYYGRSNFVHLDTGRVRSW